MMQLVALFEMLVSFWGVAGLLALWALKAVTGWGLYRIWKARRKMTGVDE